MAKESSDVQNKPPEITVPKFGLSFLFYLTAVYAAGFATGGLWTIFLTTFVMFFWWLCSISRIWAKRFLMLMALLAILFGMLLPSVSQVREAGRHTHCLNNIRQLMLAILNHEYAHQEFVSARQSSAKQPDQTEGKQPVSWRVTILPFIEEEKLYKRYNFNEAWDGPNNIKLIQEMPRIYACPSHLKTAGHTPYKLVADKGTAFEYGRKITFADIWDGSSKTIGIVEDVINPVPWTKPEDLTVEQAIKVLSPSDPRLVAHTRDHGFATYYFGSNVSLLDGSTHGVGPTIDPQTVRNLCLCADGEIVDIGDFGDSVEVIHYERYFLLAVYVVLLLLPGVYLAFKRGNADL